MREFLLFPTLFFSYISVLFLLKEAFVFYQYNQSTHIIKWIYIYGCSLIVLFILRMVEKDKKQQKGISQNIIFSLYLILVTQLLIFIVSFLEDKYQNLEQFINGWELPMVIMVTIPFIDLFKKRLLK